MDLAELDPIINDLKQKLFEQVNSYSDYNMETEDLEITINIKVSLPH